MSNTREEISMDKILEPREGQDKLGLALIEGAPGIGKSTLAWELCRKWDEFPCMEQYNLVILLRLREKEVQKIGDVSELFYSYEGNDKEQLVTEVQKNFGKNVLFVLDGFDELPQSLQCEGLLLKLIKKTVLPESTVVVTSRPSATAELLTSCGPLIQKRIEVLGFTHESVKDYAASVFSDSDQLDNFLKYISSSENPAINSLMYVPLNAAAIVQIFINSHSVSSLPRTLTELYTQLCLTVLNRHLKVKNPSGIAQKFSYLPKGLYEQFIKLSEIAFERIKRREVIFHSLSSNLVHFGFLDSVTALYGSGEISYNFLHLTLQEFFAAYHISQLSDHGAKLFQDCGHDSRWQIVWRFVAGLAKYQFFNYYSIKGLPPGFGISNVVHLDRSFIHCLFEAQLKLDFQTIFERSVLVQNNNTFVDGILRPFDFFALGFCIANCTSEKSSWIVHVEHAFISYNFFLGAFDSFIDGLTVNLSTQLSAGGTIKELHLEGCVVNITKLKLYPLQRTESLMLKNCCGFDLVHLSEMLQFMTSLNEVIIYINDSVPFGEENGMLRVLECLSQSNVTKMTVDGPSIHRLIEHVKLAQDFWFALKKLIDPSVGHLKELYIEDSKYTSAELISMVSSPSSLNTLSLSLGYGTTINEHSNLQAFNCHNNLTTLVLKDLYPADLTSTSIAHILKHSRTLLHVDLQLTFLKVTYYWNHLKKPLKRVWIIQLWNPLKSTSAQIFFSLERASLDHCCYDITPCTISIEGGKDLFFQLDQQNVYS